MTFPRNKFGVPHRRYCLALADGSSFRTRNPAGGATLRSRAIHRIPASPHSPNPPGGATLRSRAKMLPTDYPAAYPADWPHRVGLGNDADGHIEILRATDLATGRSYRNLHSWATHRVWCYVMNYAT